LSADCLPPWHGKGFWFLVSGFWFLGQPGKTTATAADKSVDRTRAQGGCVGGLPGSRRFLLAGSQNLFQALFLDGDARAGGLRHLLCHLFQIRVHNLRILQPGEDVRPGQSPPFLCIPRSTLIDL